MTPVALSLSAIAAVCLVIAVVAVVAAARGKATRREAAGAVVLALVWVALAAVEVLR